MCDVQRIYCEDWGREKRDFWRYFIRRYNSKPEKMKMIGLPLPVGLVSGVWLLCGFSEMH